MEGMIVVTPWPTGGALTGTDAFAIDVPPVVRQLQATSERGFHGLAATAE
jgi:hypothetical protein